MFLLDFDYVDFLEKETHNFHGLVDYLPWTVFTGCPKKTALSELPFCVFLGHPLAYSVCDWKGRGSTNTKWLTLADYLEFSANWMSG